MIVPISRVIPLSDNPSPSNVRRMKLTLQKQGQIEPLQVHSCYGDYMVFHDDGWANEIIFAARELGWPTLLIVVTNHYEF